MRILWSSNAPWTGSGYGVQTALVCERLKAAGHEVAIHAWYGQECGVSHWKGIPVYPRFGHAYGIDVQHVHAQDWRADLLITLIDAWVQEPQTFQQAGVRWAPWFPVDSEPIAPAIAQKVRGAYQPLVFSHTAEEECRRIGLDPIYIPHCVDTSIYKPGDRGESRRWLGWDESWYLVGMVAANKGWPSRKAFPQALEAFAEFARTRPEARIYLHTVIDPRHGGLEFAPLLTALGLDGKVLAADQYRLTNGIPPEALAHVYRACNVLLNPAMGEGCGVPILEAQCCDTPVIAGDWTAMPEHVRAGWLVPRSEADRYWMTGYNTWQMLPRVSGIRTQLENAYTAHVRGLDARRLSEGCAQVRQEFDADRVVRECWLPVLAQMDQRIHAGHGELQLVKF